MLGKKGAWIATMSLSINYLTISGHSNSRSQTLTWEWAQSPVGGQCEPCSITHTLPESQMITSPVFDLFICFRLSYFDSRLFGLGISRAWEGSVIIFFLDYATYVKKSLSNDVKKKSHLPEEGKNDIWFLHFRPGMDESMRHSRLQKPLLTINYY